eukprot:11443336-Alexandrium_andersonii.AAC.1
MRRAGVTGARGPLRHPLGLEGRGAARGRWGRCAGACAAGRGCGCGRLRAGERPRAASGA